MKQLLAACSLRIVIVGGVLTFGSVSPIAVGYNGTAFAAESSYKGNALGDQLEKSLLTLCDANSPAATYNYQHVRDQLMTYAYTEANLDEIEKLLVQEALTCSESSDVELIADLTRFVGDNWRQHGKLKRADIAYETAYKYAAVVPNNVLGEISVLQGWAKLKVQMNDDAAAEKLASLQSSSARQAYSSHKFGPELVASSLRFEATILASTGDAQGANAKNAEANAILAAAKRCVGLCRWNSGGAIHN